MRNNKSIRIISVIAGSVMFILLSTLIYTQIAEKEEPKYKLFHRLVKASIAKDFHIFWQYSGKLRRKFSGNDEHNFVEDHSKFYEKHPEFISFMKNAEIAAIKQITPNRAWITIRNLLFPQHEPLYFYFIKEEGKWKNGGWGSYFGTVNSDLHEIDAAIIQFYNEKNQLPFNLSELVPEYIKTLPLDPFSDENKPYGYEIIDEKSWKLRSVGLDSRDDFGLINYDTRSIDLGIVHFDYGDIILEGSAY